MKTLFKLNALLLILFYAVSCTSGDNGNGGDSLKSEENKLKYSVIFDTDANNELDDQHALAYLLFSGNEFDVKGVTVNTTRNGGNIDQHYAEAERVMRLCKAFGKIPLIKGADGSFEEIRSSVKGENFDGAKAVSFIIEQARKHSEQKLVLIAVGKLTNVALAVEKDPSIINNIRLVWLGANYPDPGEYNLVNDIPSMNYLLDTEIPFEMVTVRYGKPTGTDAVRVLEGEPQKTMPGLGPTIDKPVVGRHGDSFTTFGDYSVSLFDHSQYHGDPPGRSLFDMAAVAIVKNPDWAQATEIPCPIMINEKWVERPDNTRKMIVWENFDKDKIMEDFYGTLQNYILVD